MSRRSLHSASKLALLLLLLVVLAACTPLPRPFKPEAKNPDNPLLQIPDSGGVVVAPLQDAPPATAPFAEMLARSLSQADVPASTTALVKDAFLLEGRTTIAALNGDTADLAIEWRLSDETGAVVGERVTHSAVPLVAWNTGAEPLLERIARTVTPELAMIVREERPPAVDLPERAVAVATITGAPGDGREALTRALQATLRRAGMRVAETPEDAMLRLYGEVDVAALSPSRDRVSLVWTLRDAGGRTVGTLRQDNTVPTGRLSKPWGSLAFDIAMAMTDTIAVAFDRMQPGATARVHPPAALDGSREGPAGSRLPAGARSFTGL